MRFYSDPSKETDPYSLPDAEVFHWSASPRSDEQCKKYLELHFGCDWQHPTGFYYWSVFPGCLPDSDPYGPFETEQEAIDDCREQVTA